MKPRSRRGSAAGELRVHRLIAAAVLQFFVDVGGQGHLTQLIQDLLKDALVDKLDNAPAKVGAAFYNRSEHAVAKADHATGFQPSSGAHQSFPVVLIQALQQRYLAGDAAVLLLSDQPGGDHLGVIDHHCVTWIQIGWQIKKMPVCPQPIFTVADQHPASIPGIQWRLGDQLLGQIIVKIMGFHQRRPPAGCWDPPLCPLPGRGGPGGCRQPWWRPGPWGFGG